MKKLFPVIAILLIIPLISEAAERAQTRSIKVIGREAAVVTTDTVRLMDIAEISSPQVSDDEAVIGLQKVQIGTSPRPGEEITIPAASVLERLRTQGISLEQIAYTLPRIMKIKRAARPLAREEVLELVNSYMRSSGSNAALRNLSFPADTQLAPGDVHFEVQRLADTRPGRMSFTLTARVKGAEDVRINVEAEADEWREIPVASRSLARGSIVGPEDIMLARMNLANLSQDAAVESDTVLGREINRDLRPGETFSRAKLEIPPLIAAGSRVTMVSRSQFFEITASGTALEAGMAGSRIKVRNEASKKIVMGLVKDAGLVEVKQ